MIHAQEETSAEHVLGELLACPPKEWAPLLARERFRSSELLDLLLEECHAALPFDPARGEELLAAAASLAQYFEQEGETDPGFELGRKCRAYCLKGTARRLLGDHRGAEAYFEQAAFMDVSRTSRAIFCRSLGLLRWDQGRREEAGALLHQAARRFRKEEHFRERSACLALEGLLGVEQLAFWEAAKLLAKALANLDARRWPWLACRATLSLALCRLKEGGVAWAEAARQEAARLYGGIPSGEARVGLHWLEGQVAAGLGDRAGAEALLCSARQACFAARQLPEATLVTIDLVEVLVQAGRPSEIESLVGELAGAFEGRPGLDLALGCLQSLAADVRRSGGVEDPPHWLCVRSVLRLLWPQQGVFFQPVPFA